MSGFGPRLPITYSDIDGYMLLKDYASVIRQNFKMLILTNPGERIMEPDYGVGMSRFLFENFSDTTYADIDRRIRQQTKIYMPFINIVEVQFNAPDLDSNTLNVSIKYSIPQIGAFDLLQFTI
tara:strand:- start:920 stop:1288 length:369 start_codon:yes stop_codon:yes gene_type:complete